MWTSVVVLGIRGIVQSTYPFFLMFPSIPLAKGEKQKTITGIQYSSRVVNI